MRKLLLALLLAGCGETTFERARAAFEQGDLAAAEQAPGPWGDFLRGNVAFARCELAGRQAETPAAEPFAFDVAIAYGEKAQRFWERAAMSREDWPAARRNVERALRKLDELRRKKAAAEDRRKSAPKPQPRPQPDSSPQSPPQKTNEEQEAVARLDELSPAEVRKLVEKLGQKEREKLELRRKERRQRMASVERDW